MDSTAFDILQAIGLGLAFGLRPVVAPLIVAICAAARLGIDLDSTVVGDLASTPQLVAFAVFAVAWIGLEIARGPVNSFVQLAIAVVFAAAFGAGSVDEHSATWWPGIVAAVLAAALAWAALTPLLDGARQRLAGEKEAAIILPVGVELTAVLTAFLSLIVPPLAVIALIAVLVLFVQGRRNGGERYAGLRTLTK